VTLAEESVKKSAAADSDGFRISSAADFREHFPGRRRFRRRLNLFVH
jgi:hypothetical protein